MSGFELIIHPEGAIREYAKKREARKALEALAAAAMDQIDQIPVASNPDDDSQIEPGVKA